LVCSTANMPMGQTNNKKSRARGMDLSDIGGKKAQDSDLSLSLALGLTSLFILF